MPFFKAEKKAVNDLWYPRTVTVGRPLEMEDVCKRIAEMSTVSEPDSKAVLSALGKVLGDLMNTGRTVHLEGLGYFYYSCLSTGQGKEAKEDVDSDCIVGTRVQFLPERRVRQDGTVTRNLVDDSVFWVNVKSPRPTTTGRTRTHRSFRWGEARRKRRGVKNEFWYTLFSSAFGNGVYIAWFDLYNCTPAHTPATTAMPMNTDKKMMSSILLSFRFRQCYKQ